MSRRTNHDETVYPFKKHVDHSSRIPPRTSNAPVIVQLSVPSEKCQIVS